MEQKIKKVDLVVSLVIGEICALLMLFIIKNLSQVATGFAKILPYANYLPVVFPLACLVGLTVSYFIGKKMPAFYQFAKFVLVGGMNFLVDMGVLNILIFATGYAVGQGNSVLKGISFFIAVTNSYFFNKYWTFTRKTTESKMTEFLQFFLVSMAGFIINLGVNIVVVNYINPLGGMNPKAWAQVGGLVSAIVALVWNFVGYKFFVFEDKKDVTISPVQKI